MAVQGPVFARGRGVGPAGFGRCLWNFLQRGRWQESQQRGETVSALRLALCLPGAALSLLGVPQGSREEGTAAWDPPTAAGFRGRLQPSSPPCPWEHRGPLPWGCHGQLWDTLPN